jgi:putative transposase
MKGTRHSEEQIIAILKQGEAGVTTAELCRQHGISEQTYYRWKAKYGGMDSSEAKRVKQLGEMGTDGICPIGLHDPFRVSS